ncbi:ferritin family protein [Chloroflexota bacterium]
MKQSEQSILDIFDHAMQTESEGIRVYEDAIAKAQDDKAKEIFQMLATAEHRHLSLIKATREEVKATYTTHLWKGDFISDIGKEIETIGRLYIPKITEETISAGELDAIDMGIKVEQASIDFYTDAKNKMEDPGVANLFNILVGAERMHLLLLEMHKFNIAHPRRT